MEPGFRVREEFSLVVVFAALDEERVDVIECQAVPRVRSPATSTRLRPLALSDGSPSTSR